MKPSYKKQRGIFSLDSAVLVIHLFADYEIRLVNKSSGLSQKPSFFFSFYMQQRRDLTTIPFTNSWISWGTAHSWHPKGY